MASSKTYEVNHNLAVANPIFLGFIQNIRKEMGQWIQYRGAEVQDTNRLYFKFQSSQNSLSFTVYAGVYKGEHHMSEIQASSNEIYDYFRDLKYANLND